MGMLFRSAQADQIDSTAALESTIVPSMSNRTAWIPASRESVRVIAASILPGHLAAHACGDDQALGTEDGPNSLPRMKHATSMYD